MPGPHHAAPALPRTPPAPAASARRGAAQAERIGRSHERSAAHGLARIGEPDFAPLGHADLGIARERNRRLYNQAAPLMDMLFDQIRGSESMVVLCDASGLVLHAVGDDDFLGRASRVALQPGADWSEAAKGTNAIGTALVDELPTLVHGDEHYMVANQFLTCSAAPILDPRGQVLGVLDVTGDHRSYHHHTMALVRMTARMIENHWLTDCHQRALRLHFHPRAECLGTLVEGLLALAPDGRVLGCNRGAQELLGLDGAAVRRLDVEALFGCRVETLIDRFRSPLAGPLRLASERGAFHVQARFSAPIWGDVSEAVPAAAPPALPASTVSAGADAGSLEMLRRQAIRDAVAAAGGNVAAAARRLGVSRNTVYRSLRASGSVAPAERPAA